MILKRNQRCPIHGQFTCCGREKQLSRVRNHSKWERVRSGVSRIRDVNARHPDGYRYRLSKAAMALLLISKVRDQHNECAICHEPFTDMQNVVADHREPKGMASSWRDDRGENIQAVHQFPCNLNKGSQRMKAA